MNTPANPCPTAALPASPGPPNVRTHATVQPARPRLDVIDFLRGLVMVVMVLDHTRDFLGGSASNPRDVAEPALFLTRWITHFCAPIFVFLAGVSAFLYGSRGRTKRELSRFLLTRGLWLVALELTVVKLGWTFSVQPDVYVLQVIWAIGSAMIALAALVHLPRWVIAAFALALVGGHNLLDDLKPESFGALAWLWNLLHAPTMLAPFRGTQVLALYPLIPWIGVLALGYVFGPVMLLAPVLRRRWAVTLGVTTLVMFVGLRGLNLYGDPAPRIIHDSVVPTVLSFLNCEKYPPSLHYLTMTLGPALLALGLVDGIRSRLGAIIVTFGRVPMFYYVAHLFVIHTVAVGCAWITGSDSGWLFSGMTIMAKPAGFGFSLPAVYAAWILIVASLYPACRWFASLKQRRKDWWLSYL